MPALRGAAVSQSAAQTLDVLSALFKLLGMPGMLQQILTGAGGHCLAAKLYLRLCPGSCHKM